jgi:hypothetical protein
MNSFGPVNEEEITLLESGMSGRGRREQTKSSSSSYTVKVVLVSGCVLLLLGAAIISSRPGAYSHVHGLATSLIADSTAQFSTGRIKYTSGVPDGRIETLSSLSVDCGDSALIGFQMIYTSRDDVKYGYYCDSSGAPTFDEQSTKTNFVKHAVGGSVNQLSQFTVDCNTFGVNYVLDSFRMKTQDDTDLAYGYSCSSYEDSILTCSQFYTDLADPANNDEGGDPYDISTLSNQNVMCYDGSALQTFQYQRAEGKIRYAYTCCIKAEIPTPAPTMYPTLEPSREPTLEPSEFPTKAPAGVPTYRPTTLPTLEPTMKPTLFPTLKPSRQPTEEPTAFPIAEPSFRPTIEPTTEPTHSPIAWPTREPTLEPTREPTKIPSKEPTLEPTFEPTKEPTLHPTTRPSLEPTHEPTKVPSTAPTFEPTDEPTHRPISEPTLKPTREPTQSPTLKPSPSEPTLEPSREPSLEPTFEPTYEPSHRPISDPTLSPTKEPSQLPTLKPSREPTFEPTRRPQAEPTMHPSKVPTLEPTHEPTAEPSKRPTLVPTLEPTLHPTHSPTSEPVDSPTAEPSQKPSRGPTQEPTNEPVFQPTKAPRLLPTEQPVTSPTHEPIALSTNFPVTSPTPEPTVHHLTKVEVESYNLPRYCPFTYLAGHTKLDIPAGCAFFSDDNIDYMQTEETSASLIICSAAELGNIDLDLKDFQKFGLADKSSGESKISYIVPGPSTVVPIYTGMYTNLVDVYTHKHHPALSTGDEPNDAIKSAVLSTAISAKDVMIPSLCGDSTASVEEAVETGNKMKEMLAQAKLLEEKARAKLVSNKTRR